MKIVDKIFSKSERTIRKTVKVDILEKVIFELSIKEIAFLRDILDANLVLKSTIHRDCMGYYSEKGHKHTEEFQFMIETFKDILYKKNKEKYDL